MHPAPISAKDRSDARTTSTTRAVRRPTVAPPTPARPRPSSGRAPQFVLVGLDVTPGADLATTFARRVGDAAEAAGAHITYFINTQFFLLPPGTHRRTTLAPDARRWEDPDSRVLRRIGYSHSVAESTGRLATTRYLLDHGHEVASHGVHHERGGSWSPEAWRAELIAFNRHQHDLLGLPAVAGFRAPYLAPGQGLHPVEAAIGLHYDASRVVPLRAWPWRLGLGGPWEIAVMSGRFQNCRTAVFHDAMAVCGFRASTLQRVLLEEFEARYQGNRAPFVLSAHDGLVESVYLPILRAVCARPEVRCTTFAELADYMDEHPAIAAWGRQPSQTGAPPDHASHVTP